MKGSKKGFVLLLAVVCFLTNISQLPIVVESGMTQFLSAPGWLLVISVLLYCNLMKFGKMELSMFFLGLLFLLGIVISEIFTYNNHLSSNLIFPFYMSIFILFIGISSSNAFNSENFKLLAKAYIAGVLLVSISIYVEFFSNGIDWYSRSYAYGSKNSISQMILTAVVFLYLLFKPKKLSLKLFKSILLLFWIFLLFALKSRATILGVFIALLIILFSRIDKKKRLITFGIILASFLIFLINPTLNNIIVEGVLLGGRDTNLNDLSSGRTNQIFSLFPDLIKGHELLGTGTLYVESFIFNSLLKHGLLFGWILILVAILPIYWGLKYLDKSKSINITFLIIAITYFINGMFEAQAPFGPGTKNYILWLMFGLLYGFKRNKKKSKHSRKGQKFATLDIESSK
ncbi:hypothetical protein G159_16285 [Planococcus glaciei CHR43]|uniref:hypothetical protein n=1 Tax=Planococcus glaciei TaxID=459472 RepID=UPI0003DF29E6|nr:hypothetical protein [Planococcus glaciei]ETP67657.1 hypothetical protein G159_16285 [Planococcus glaciei CHR43]